MLQNRIFPIFIIDEDGNFFVWDPDATHGPDNKPGGYVPANPEDYMANSADNSENNENTDDKYSENKTENADNDEDSSNPASIITQEEFAALTGFDDNKDDSNDKIRGY